MASTGLAPAGKVFQGLAVAFAAAVIPYYLVNVKKVFGGALRRCSHAQSVSMAPRSPTRAPRVGVARTRLSGTLCLRRVLSRLAPCNEPRNRARSLWSVQQPYAQHRLRAAACAA